jgi:hypothetical protein
VDREVPEVVKGFQKAVKPFLLPVIAYQKNGKNPIIKVQHFACPRAHRGPNLGIEPTDVYAMIGDGKIRGDAIVAMQIIGDFFRDGDEFLVMSSIDAPF